MPTNLYFDLAPVVRLANHAIAAATHAVDPAGLTDADTPALWLVTETDGIWLVSNGLPVLPVDVLRPDIAPARVFARSWEPDSPALAGRLAAHDLAPITVIHAPAQPINALPALLSEGHQRLRIAVAHGGVRMWVDKLELDPDAGQPTDAVATWLRAELGDSITGRPWRDGPEQPCRAHAELAALLDEAADTLQEGTILLTQALRGLRDASADAAAELSARGWASDRNLMARTINQHRIQAQHEMVRNLLVQLYTAWRNTHTDCGGCHPTPPTGDQPARG
jgi:hypothetical protein